MGMNMIASLKNYPLQSPRFYTLSQGGRFRDTEAACILENTILSMSRPCPGETLDHEKYGILVTTESADAIAEALMKVLSQGELKKSLSTRSFKRAQDFGLDGSMRQ